MNMQKRADERSKMLQLLIAKKLRKNPELWEIPMNNIGRWKKAMRNPAASMLEWEKIFRKYGKQKILRILEGDSEESIRLRSSSPFTGILSERERMAIFELFGQGGPLEKRTK